MLFPSLGFLPYNERGSVALTFTLTMTFCSLSRAIAGLTLPAAFAGLVLTLSTPLAAQDEGVTIRTLLAELTDLRPSAEFPSPAFTTHQASSYDRKATAPGSESWFANSDWGQFLRVEQRNGRQEQVMMDAKGPGAVVHMWSANPSGTLRVYLDGREFPVIEARMEELLGGKVPGFPQPLGGVQARGYNLYFPIPYARSCKITCDEGKPYYIVNYRTYAAGTPVKTFSRLELARSRAEIREAADRAAAPEKSGVQPTRVARFNKTLAPGATVSLGRLRGSRAITRFAVQPEAADLNTALRSAVLRITFDGETTVETPLGDFFGAAPGVARFATLPFGGTEAGELWSHWVMPFRKSARVEVTNTGKAPLTLRGSLGTIPYQWTPNTMHFHAGYRARYGIPTRPMSDMNFLQARGKGVFSGLSLAIDNPVKAWWGEGDEKIYVDGERFPSFFGTGTEDYFGYAWSNPQKFTHAFHAQPVSIGTANYGRFSNARFHLADRIPFQQSLKFDMEMWHWQETKVNVATVAYWYAVPGGTADFAPLKPADLVVAEMPEYTPPRVAGAIEGETMQVLRKTATASQQDWPGLSGEAQLWWRETPKPGDVLALRFDAPRAGRYRVLGRFLKARDYGIHQLAINGRKAGAPIDFFNPETVVPTGEIDLGTFDLKQGANELTVTVVGANEKAVKGYMFGLDYLMLKPVP